MSEREGNAIHLTENRDKKNSSLKPETLVGFHRSILGISSNREISTAETLNGTLAVTVFNTITEVVQ
jgi:hypothetical protein